MSKKGKLELVPDPTVIRPKYNGRGDDTTVDQLADSDEPETTPANRYLYNVAHTDGFKKGYFQGYQDAVAEMKTAIDTAARVNRERMNNWTE